MNPLFLRHTKEFVSKSIVTIFFCFLFLVMSFGRSFCITRFDTPFMPIFITEVMLLLGSVVIFFNFKQLLKIPKYFLVILALYFFMGNVYFVRSIFDAPMPALRDIVYFAYVVFFMLGFIVFCEFRNVKTWVWIVLGSNVVAIIFGRFFLISPYQLPTVQLRLFVLQNKAVHIGFFYCIASFYLMTLHRFAEKRLYRFGIILLLVLDVYMMFVLAQRSIWFSFLGSAVLIAALLRSEFKKVLMHGLLVAFIIFPLLYYFDYINEKTRMPHVDFNLSIIEEQNAATANIQLLKVRGLIKGIAALGDVGEIDTMGESTEGLNGFLNYLKYLLEKAKAQFQDDVLVVSSAHSIFWRLELWIAYVQVAVQYNPYFGVGFGRYPSPFENPIIGFGDGLLANKKRPTDEPAFHVHHEKNSLYAQIKPAHNYLISIFYKMGLIGLLLFVTLIAHTFRVGFKFIRSPNLEPFERGCMIAHVAAFLTWNISAFFFDLVESPPTSMVLWILMGLIHSMANADQSVQTERPPLKYQAAIPEEKVYV